MFLNKSFKDFFLLGHNVWLQFLQEMRQKVFIKSEEVNVSYLIVKGYSLSITSVIVCTKYSLTARFLRSKVLSVNKGLLKPLLV